ncbi:MAG TPA: hypothetical protein VMV48_00870 [Gallionellaceae bacterium]|nr:hypothetical protein [Gallionellaceae bacterium]
MKKPILNMRQILMLIGVLVLFASSGCANHTKVDFKLTNGDFKSKGKSIAIISGTKVPENLVLASLVADSLRKNSRFQVSTTAQISKAVEPYPRKIKGPYKSAYFDIDKSWDMGDKEKIAEIQRALGVDYLYVIWTPIAMSNRSDRHSILPSVPVVAQLFEQPAAKEVARTDAVIAIDSDDRIGDEKNPAFREGANEISRQLVEATNMAVADKR